MFTDFFYMLKAKGLEVSMTEWLTFLEALDKGLADSSFTKFYYLGRMILVKTESDYDKYDFAFQEYYKGIQSEDKLPDKILEWLHADEERDDYDPNKDLYKFNQKRTASEVKRMFNERLTEQNSEHNGGNFWIGTSGGSAFGHSGRNVGGIRVAGTSGMRSAFAVVGEHKYADFRQDRVLSMRQFQVAFRRLRQYSSRLDVAKTELDIDKTIDSTCNQGGILKLEYDKPRKNTVKLLLLFDCGGTMYPFTALCNTLFQAVNKANHFKDVKTYYFHNCIYSHVYKSAECELGDWIKVDEMMKLTDKDYKVIIVGDAAMAPEELYDKTGNYRGPNEGLSGYEWNVFINNFYKKIIWLNPKYHPGFNTAHWMESEKALAELYHMYPLTVDGLKQGIKYLMAPK
ncbi:MAG: VWA containing CoxE family protein [Lachnospiraceae bacterium]|nr:VWA containing CoxE family protein [Lachnospiraceae bacterium]